MKNERKISEYDKRQLEAMYESLVDFRKNRIGLCSLIGNLEFLLAALEFSDDNWREEFLNEITVLETINAINLENENFPESKLEKFEERDGINHIKTSTLKLRLIITKKINQICIDKKLIGGELRIELLKGFDIIRISRWAFHLLSENLGSLDPDIQDILEELFGMKDGSQFELAAEELTKLAEKLISEGEKEEIENLVNEIKYVATSLGEKWIMCPLCQEAWEDFSENKIVLCPKCSSKLRKM